MNAVRGAYERSARCVKRSEVRMNAVRGAYEQCEVRMNAVRGAYECSVSCV